MGKDADDIQCIEDAASVIALIACANCTHQPNGDSACAKCIADAVRGYYAQA